MKSIHKKLTLASALMLTMLTLGACANSNTSEKGSKDSTDKTEEVAKKHDLKYVDENGIITIGEKGAVAVSDIKKDKPKITIYFDPMCPACSLYEHDAAPYLLEEAEKGEIYVQYAPMMFLDKASPDNYSSRASAYILGIAEYAPELVGKFIPKIMENQPGEGTGESLAQADFNKFFKEVGGTEEQVDKINSAMKDNMTLSYNSTLTMFKDTNLLKLSPTGELYTPFIVPSNKDGKQFKAVDLVQGQLLENTKKAVEEIK